VSGRETLAVNNSPTIPATPRLDMSADGILEDFSRYFGHMLGERAEQDPSPFVYKALVYTTRDRLLERWKRTNAVIKDSDCRRVSYLSLEFLIGRLLRNALFNLDVDEAAAAALEKAGLDLEEVCELEHDAGLGNGGLGRLAACFLDSCATLRLPVLGYGLRYRYGMFHQRIEGGYQVEAPDPWLRDGFPWEVERYEFAQVIRFGGYSEPYHDDANRLRHRLVATHDVLAIPFDVPIPGYQNGVVNTLRLWSSAATDEFDLEEFNAGDYTEAVAAKNAAENITMVLYPNAVTETGRELRLRQQYLLASASLQDTIRDWCERHGEDFSEFAARNCFQLNDTHPAVAVPELMRILLDDHGLEWDDAWEITRQTMAYTNHTLLPEALEVWSESLFARLLPRVLEIIREINERFVAELRERWPDDEAKVSRMSLIGEGHEPVVRMAYLAIVGSFSINGVAALHSQLLQDGLFNDFFELWPERFNNKTNGVTQRRWLAACNTALSELISAKLGDGWITNLDQLEGLKDFADDAEFQALWQAVKLGNKKRLAALVEQRSGLSLDSTMLFDVQVKRIHEYKRQLLNLLHAVHLYDRIVRGDDDGLVPRAILIGGKAAPGYDMAKGIIKCINSVADVINSDPLTAGKLRLVFIPDYNVSAMEVICPAAELSEQISTAGKEASGTGNMKFMMNGALTIGTLDGANVEIREAVGEENFFLFGNTVDEIDSLRSSYDPNAIIAADADFSRVMQRFEGGQFDGAEHGVHSSVILAIRNPHDQWMTAADFRSFIDAQQRVNEAYKDTAGWTRMSILNTASSGRFSTDRTMRDYNREIWRAEAIDPKTL
jgi:glycogen phosphorylase